MFVRTYLENIEKCRRLQLMEYFIGNLSKDSEITLDMCCDIVAIKVVLVVSLDQMNLYL